MLHTHQGNGAPASCKYQWFAFFPFFFACLVLRKEFKASSDLAGKLSQPSESNPGRPAWRPLNWESFLDSKRIRVDAQHPELRHSFAAPESAPELPGEQLLTGAGLPSRLRAGALNSEHSAPNGPLDSSEGGHVGPAFTQQPWKRPKNTHFR